MTTQILTEIRQANNLVKELATRAEFQNDVIILSGFGEVDELHDVGMIDLPHYLHLFQDVCSLFRTDQSACARPLAIK